MTTPNKPDPAIAKMAAQITKLENIIKILQQRTIVLTSDCNKQKIRNQNLDNRVSQLESFISRRKN